MPDTGFFTKNVVERFRQTGSQWALLHHSRKEQAVTDGICYKIDI
ncbi:MULTISPECIES: hypothetical protein [unclassified Wolbachia]|nr:MULTISPECIES: hypothetical protein [unclassified Wolbachia]